MLRLRPTGWMTLDEHLRIDCVLSFNGPLLKSVLKQEVVFVFWT